MSDSLPYNDQKGCPIGYHKRSSYTSKLGHRVSPRCVKSTTVYLESRKNMTRRLTRQRQSRLQSMGKNGSANVKCPPGMISRKAYVRKFSRGLMERGYTVKRGTGIAYRIKPKHSSVYVKPGCIKKPGYVKNPGKLTGAMRKGELIKHGYAYTKSESERHDALKKAIYEFGALGVFRKLNAVARFSKYTHRDAYAVFKRDREWIKAHYELKAPQGIEGSK